MYGEDIDWCYRFRQAGEGVMFFSQAEAIHYGGASSSNSPVRFYLEMCRANWQYWQKHKSRLSQFAFLAIIAVSHAARVVGAALGYLLRPAERDQYAFRMQKSAACLRWSAQTFIGQLPAPPPQVPSQPTDCSTSHT
jgi:GT2 family glycosyltransferase